MPVWRQVPEGTEVGDLLDPDYREVLEVKRMVSPTVIIRNYNLRQRPGWGAEHGVVEEPEVPFARLGPVPVG